VRPSTGTSSFPIQENKPSSVLLPQHMKCRSSAKANLSHCLQNTRIAFAVPKCLGSSRDCDSSIPIKCSGRIVVMVVQACRQSSLHLQPNQIPYRKQELIHRSSDLGFWTLSAHLRPHLLLVLHFQQFLSCA
jgi:hypothetical protein